MLRREGIALSPVLITIWSVRVTMLRETCDSVLPPPSEVNVVTSLDFADTPTSRIFARSARARLRASS